jgi:hypothetical protein
MNKNLITLKRTRGRPKNVQDEFNNKKKRGRPPKIVNKNPASFVKTKIPKRQKTTMEEAKTTLIVQCPLVLWLSGIKDAGLGVYTKIPFYEGDCITLFSYDEVIDEAVLNQWRKEGSQNIKYVLQINGHLYAGCTQMKNGIGFGSFINTARGSKNENNCKFVMKDDGNIYVVATKMINAYTELFVPYGIGYRL